MSIRHFLSDPTNEELLNSQQMALVLTHDGHALQLVAASKGFRQTHGFESGHDWIVQRYGQTVSQAIADQLIHAQGWVGCVNTGQEWLHVQVTHAGRYAIAQESAITRHTTETAEAPQTLSKPQQVVNDTVMLVTDDQGRLLRVNQQLADFLGQNHAQLIGMDASNLLFRTDIGHFRRMLNAVRYQNHASADGGFRLRNTAAEVCYFDWTATCNGSEILFIGKGSRTQLQEALLQSEERINNILESMEDAFFAIDENGCLAYLNRKGAELLGKPPAGLLGRSLWDRAPRLKKTPLYHHLNSAKSGNQAEAFQWEDGQTHCWYQVKIYSSGKLISVFFTDISDIKQQETQAKHQALHDSLTGLPNRLALSQSLEEIIGNDEFTDFKMGLLFIDLDGFKGINDTLGHDCGDDLLREVSQRLCQTTRSTDIVARLSGDEFVVTLPYISDSNDALLVGQKIVESISQIPFELAGQRVYMGASVGLALFPDDSSDPEGLLKCADIAMYRAKQTGKNRIQQFHADMRSELQAKLSLEYDLPDALKENRFEVYYQPRFNAELKPCGAEALLRLRSPDGKLISPEKFIPIAESSGMIVPIGRYVLSEACQWLRDLHQQGHTHLSVSVNVSALQLVTGKLANTVAEVLAEHRLPARALELELTESTLIQHETAVTRDLQMLNQLGVKLAIDDFGTGYSSLQLLMRMHVDTIKLDRSFVSGLPDRQDSAVITKSVQALAQSMGMELVAEGVETQAQLDCLLKLGFQEFQGFGLSKPLPATEAAQFVSGPMQSLQLA